MSDAITNAHDRAIMLIALLERQKINAPGAVQALATALGYVCVLAKDPERIAREAAEVTAVVLAIQRGPVVTTDDDERHLRIVPPPEDDDAAE